MGGDAITIKSGTILTLDLFLVDNDKPPVPVPLSFANQIVFEVFDGARVIIQKTYAGSAITVADMAGGEIKINFYPDDTSPAFGVGSSTDPMVYDYELRIYFNDGSQIIAMAGTLTITPTKTWKGSDAITSGADRVVYVQGRY